MIGALLLTLALSAAEDDAIRRADLGVDTSALGGAGPILQERIRERVAVQLRDAEILPARSHDAPLLEITLTPGEGGEFSFKYQLRLLVGDPRRVPLQRQGECASCTEGEIVDRLVAAVDELLPELRTHAAIASADETRPATPPPSGEPPAAIEGPSSPPPLAVDVGPATPRVGPLGKGGIAAISLGAAAAAVGVVFALRPPTPLEDQPLFVRNTRPPGLAVAISGGGLLVGGVALLLVDRARARARGRAHARESARR